MAKKVYIDREAAENHMTIKAAQDRDSARRTWARAIASLADLPAADVVEVRHGRWVDLSNCEQCSVCGIYKAKMPSHLYDRFNYCPACGARMDLGEVTE